MTHTPPPDRIPPTQAADRAARRAARKGMTAAEMVQVMPDAELRHNAGRGGVAAIAEVQRRALQAMKVLPGAELNLGV